MKYMTIGLTVLLLGWTEVSGQGHIAPCTGSGNHSGGICYGYATGRAAGRFAGDASCDPLTLYLTAISPDFFAYAPDPSLSGLQPEDIVVFSDHAAYVVSVGNPVGLSRVDQYSTMRHAEERGLLLDDVRREFGAWTGFYRRKPVSVTVQNSFPGGVVRINGAVELPGTRTLPWWNPQNLEAVNRQNILDPSNNTYYVRVFDYWTLPFEEGERSASLSVSITPRPGKTYTANFLKEFNITFQNNLPGATGGSIKVAGTTQTAPYVAAVIQFNSITGEAIYQVVSDIQYTFSQWGDGITTNPRTFTPTDHATYTANFNAKPLPPPNVSARGPVGSYVQVRWSEHPHPSVTQYQI